MKSITIFFYKIILMVKKIIYRLIILSLKRMLFAECGKKVYIGSNTNMTYKNISIGDNVSIGDNAMFMSTRARIILP